MLSNNMVDDKTLMCLNFLREAFDVNLMFETAVDSEDGLIKDIYKLGDIKHAVPAGGALSSNDLIIILQKLIAATSADKFNHLINSNFKE